MIRYHCANRKYSHKLANKTSFGDRCHPKSSHKHTTRTNIHEKKRPYIQPTCEKRGHFPWNTERNTLPETNSSPLKIGLPNRRVVFQPSIFRSKLLVSGRVCLMSHLFCRGPLLYVLLSCHRRWGMHHQKGGRL